MLAGALTKPLKSWERGCPVGVQGQAGRVGDPGCRRLAQPRRQRHQRRWGPRSPAPGSGVGPSLRWAGGCRLSSAGRAPGVCSPGSYKVIVSKGRSEHFLFPAIRLRLRKPLPQGLPSAPDSRRLLRVTQDGRRASPRSPHRPPGRRRGGGQAARAESGAELGGLDDKSEKTGKREVKRRRTEAQGREPKPLSQKVRGREEKGGGQTGGCCCPSPAS